MFARPPRRRAIALRSLSAVLLAAVSGGLVACASGSGDTLAEAVSSERGSRSEIGGSGDEAGTGGGSSDPAATEEFCAKAQELDSMPDGSIDDSEAQAEAKRRFDELIAVAPDEIRGDLEVYAGLIDELMALDEAEKAEDPEAGMDAVMELLFDPRVLAAGIAIESFLADECGIEASTAGGLGTGEDMFGDGESEGDLGSGSDEDGPGGADISLDDLEAIEEANAGTSWTEKVSSTSILNDSDVQLIAPANGEGTSAPLTSEEAVAACEAVRTALETRQPELTVEVLNAETVVARGAAGVPCTPG